MNIVNRKNGENGLKKGENQGFSGGNWGKLYRLQNTMHHNGLCMTAYFYAIVLQNFENPVIKQALFSIHYITSVILCIATKKVRGLRFGWDFREHEIWVLVTQHHTTITTYYATHHNIQLRYNIYYNIWCYAIHYATTYNTTLRLLQYIALQLCPTTIYYLLP